MKAQDHLLLTLGHKLQQKRREQEMSQEMLAKKAGLPRTYISDVENGKRNLSFCNVVSMATALGTTVAELATGIEDAEAPSQRF
jgi:transcriptional regulator with XRE-family HTH domain